MSVPLRAAPQQRCRFGQLLDDHLDGSLRALWLTLGSAVAAELCGLAGARLAIIDAEHAPNDRAAVQAQLQALAGTDASAVVRLPDGAHTTVGQYLDLGPAAIMVPQVDSAEQARDVVASALYPPLGRRGVGAAFTRGGEWGLGHSGPGANGLAAVNGEQAVIVQLESRAALLEATAIMTTPGVEAVFVGTSDLAADLGHLGQPAHPEVVEAVERVIEQGRRVGVPVAVNAFDPTLARRYAAGGAAFVASASDASLLVAGVRLL